MKSLLAFLFLLAMLLAANFIAQWIMPTMRSSGLDRRLGYYFVVVGVFGGLLLVLIAFAAIFS